MSTTQLYVWGAVFLLLLLHTAWSMADAILQRNHEPEAKLTPASTLPFFWGAAIVCALVQLAYLGYQLATLHPSG